jgi:predicted esterase
MRGFVLLLWAAAALADGYPEGRSVHTIEGAETALLVPQGLSPERPGSLVILLHGNGDSGPGIVDALGAWEKEGYVVCAPTATGGNWDPEDLRIAKAIAIRLMKSLAIDRRKVHAVGFSNGGWNVDAIAFDEDLKPASATWIAAGFRGGAVGKWAKKGLGALALAGADDKNADAAVKTVDLLRDKVRSVEVRLQKGLGHEWPREHDAYLLWWMGAMEGRFEPGKDLNFAWADDLDAALAELKPRKKGGVLVYAWSPDDTAKPEAKALQNEVLMDPLVRHYGSQLAAVKLEAGDPVAVKLGVTATPAIAVLDREGNVRKLLQGKIAAKALAAALKSVAPDAKPPKG